MNYNNNDYELLYLISENNEDAKEIFYKKYKPTIEILAKKYYLLVKSSGVELNDLIQEGMIGLTKAINDYKEQKNIKFSTFANKCIERHILTYIRNNTRNKHKALNSSLSMESTTNSVGVPIKETIVDLKNPDPEKLFIESEYVNNINQRILNELSELEKNVILLKIDGFSQKEIASKLNTSVKSVENAISRAKNKIRNNNKSIDE